jgi:hypothetical protein
MIFYKRMGHLHYIAFSDTWSSLIIKVFERALNCWSNPPRELIDILDQMKERK